MIIFENYGFGKWREGCGTIRASGGDLAGGSEMLCVGCAWERCGGVSPTLTGDHENRVTDYTVVVAHPKKTGALCANSHPGSYTGQDAFNDMLPVIPSDKPPRKYIVRRLTPLECCRLQGFPDWWETGCDDRVKAFRDLRNTWPEFDKQFRNTRNFEFDWNWYRDHLDTEASVDGSDSARYKMWGNGIALPCAVDVLSRVAKECKNDTTGRGSTGRSKQWH